MQNRGSGKSWYSGRSTSTYCDRFMFIADTKYLQHPPIIMIIGIMFTAA